MLANEDYLAEILSHILRLSSAAPYGAWSSKLVRPTEVAALEGYRIWIRFSDGSAGEVDLTDLAGRGVFVAWNDPKCFKAVCLGPAGGVAWGDDIELCPDALYMELSGKSLEEVFSGATLQAEGP